MGAGGFIRSANAAVLRAADRIVGPQNRLRRAMSPLYSSLLDLMNGGRGYPVEINGQVFRIDPRFRWSAGPAYEREVAQYLAGRVKPGQVCFDVGANVGVYVLQLAGWSAPDGRVVAFEPNPATLPVLRRHIALNGLGARVSVVAKGVGARPGGAVLYDDAAGSGLSRVGGRIPGSRPRWRRRRSP